MISKPLFKQSCKANAWTWTFVTAITCFMLAILILVLGNLNVSGIRDSMSEMFISNAIESSVEKQSMTYYNMTENALASYEENYAQLKMLIQVQLQDEQKAQLAGGYDMAIANGATHEEAKLALTAGQDAATAMAIGTFLDYYSVYGTDYSDEKISAYILGSISSNIYNQLVETEGEETANYASQFISQAIGEYIMSGSSDTIDFATAYIPTVLKTIFFEQSFDYQEKTISVSDYFTEEEIENTSSTSIVSYRAQMDIKEAQIREEMKLEEGYDDLTTEQIDAEVSVRLQTYSETLIADMSKSLLDDIPENVSKALSELGDLDIYSLVIGSIFFKIAGLLLPIIYIIMTANNLIASQVDSGSMAYVLSTPTKRRTVTITQMVYLISSLFAMFLMTTIVGIVCLAIVGTEEITISFGQMLLFNLGGFITTFAISGICFLASSWFNRSKVAMSIGGGLSMFFLVATILGLFGSKVIPSAMRIDAMNYFNYVSLISLFDVTSIMEGTLAFLWKLAILLVVGVVTYFIAIKKFNKKDLPL